MTGPPMRPAKLIAIRVTRLYTIKVVEPGVGVERRVVVGIKQAATVFVCSGSSRDLNLAAAAAGLRVRR